MTTKHQPLPDGDLEAPQLVSVQNLYLDPENPRLAGLELTVDDQDKIARILWQDRAVSELVDSIAATGYWQHEELFAAPQGRKLVVIEGNRRLAAVKLLVDDGLRGRIGVQSIPELSASNKDKLKQLPVIRCSREQLWQYIGFKHVSGPQDWDSIAKAQYIARVHNGYKIPLERIARTIGDRHDTVKRLYRGLMVLDQAERAGVFSRDDRYNSRFFYSHLWTGLGLSGIQSFLGLTPESGFGPDPVPKRLLGNLGELCLWLFGSKEHEKAPQIKSQNPDLRKLDETLKSKNGLAALRAGLPLDNALKASRGDERLLLEAMVLAEQKLKEARGLVLTGYHGDSDLLAKAQAISLIASDISDEMKEIHDSGRRKGAKARGRRQA